VILLSLLLISSLALRALFDGMEASLLSLGRNKVGEMMEELGIKGDLETIFGTFQISSDLFLAISFVFSLQLSLSISEKIGIPGWICSLAFLAIIWSFLSGLSFVTKLLVRRSSEAIARSSLRFISGFGRVFHILYAVSVLPGKGAKLLLGLRGMGDMEVFAPMDEIDILVGDESIPEERELKAEMIHGIFEISDKVVREIMVPRVDIVAIDMRSSLEEIVDTIMEEGYSRLPVYDGTIDNIVGLVYAKDLLGVVRSEGLIILQDIIRPAYFVPETKRIMELFREFQKMRIHMAIVVDEYGGVAGLVTMEDIIEEIVGEIRDEYDVEEGEMMEVGEDGMVVVNARCRIEDFNRRMEAGLPERDDIDTVGGLIMDLFGRLPRIGEEIEVEDFVFRVLDADERRIRRLLVWRRRSGNADT
jgi:putative hemolysin